MMFRVCFVTLCVALCAAYQPSAHAKPDPSQQPIAELRYAHIFDPATIGDEKVGVIYMSQIALYEMPTREETHDQYQVRCDEQYCVMSVY